MPAAPPANDDRLSPAVVLLILAAVLTILPAVIMTTDHLVRQKPGLERQAAVHAALGFTSPCFFPTGHPARTMIDNPSPVDWRPSAALPQAVPGPSDLLRPRATPLERAGNAH